MQDLFKKKNVWIAYIHKILTSLHMVFLEKIPLHICTKSCMLLRNKVSFTLFKYPYTGQHPEPIPAFIQFQALLPEVTILHYPPIHS
jgi:hypothetical protein